MGCVESQPDQIPKKKPPAKPVPASSPPAPATGPIPTPPLVSHVPLPRLVTVSDYEYSYTDSEAEPTQ
jgi:hypothetical protein